jgi:small subunit ribosomal protein S4
VSQNDEIAIAPGTNKNVEIKMAADNAKAGQTPAWLQVDHDALKGVVAQLPTREDIDIEIQEQLIVELYSK